MKEMNRNKEFLLRAQAAKLDQQRVTALSWAISLLIEHHGGQAAIELATIAACQATVHQIAPVVQQEQGRLILTVTDQNGVPKVTPRPASVPASAVAQDVCKQSPDGLAHFDAESLTELLQAFHEMASRGEQERRAPLVAPEPPREIVERCDECGWAYGEHKEGCTLACTAAPKAAAVQVA